MMLCVIKKQPLMSAAVSHYNPRRLAGEDMSVLSQNPVDFFG